MNNLTKVDQRLLEASGRADRWKHLLESELWSDCEFLVGEEHSELVKAHRFPLTVASPVFECMFRGSIRETTGKPIEVPDVSADTFKLLLHFIYTDKFDVHSVQEALNLYRAAHKYMMPDLVTLCSKYLQLNVTPKTTWQTIQCARLYEDDGLLETSMKMLRTNTRQVLKSSALEDIDFSLLHALLDERKLALNSELELFEACVTWTLSECERRGMPPKGANLRKCLGDAVCKIRFLTLTCQEFGKAAQFGLLTTEEVTGIFMFLITNGQTPPPPLLCVETKKRFSDTIFANLEGLCLPNLRPKTLSPHIRFKGAQRCFHSTEEFVFFEQEILVTDMFVLVEGLVLPTQEVNLDVLKIIYPNSDLSTYEEEVRVYVRTGIAPAILGSGIFKGRVHWGSQMTVKLENLLHVTKAMSPLSVRVHFNTKGWYPFSTPSLEHCKMAKRTLYMMPCQHSLILGLTEPSN